MIKPSLINTLILIARPAAGKSEIIDYLSKLSKAEREQKFHLGKIIVLDDFPMLWTWFEEDDILESMGFPRIHSTKDGYFMHQYLWDVLIKRLNLEHHKKVRDQGTLENTILIEFSRGSEHGGYTRALQLFDADILAQAAILYVSVPWEESLRKNRKRFNPDKPDSILEHALSDQKLEILYREDDWYTLTSDTSGFLEISGTRVPFVVFPNEDDVTSKLGLPFTERMQQSFDVLWRLYVV